MLEQLSELINNWQIDGYVYSVFLVFCRIAGVVALLPGIGEQFVPLQIKLFFAVSLSFALQPLITDNVAHSFQDVSLYRHIFFEVIAGSVLGLWIRLLFQALTMAAGFCSQVLGITNIFDSTIETGGAPALSGFFSFTAIALIMASGGHYFFIKSIIESYQILPFISQPDFGVLSESIIASGTKSFSLGLRVALPFLAIGFLVNIGLGFINRAMPQIPVFFVGQPLMIVVGFFVLSLLMPAIMFNWSDALREFIAEQL